MNPTDNQLDRLLKAAGAEQKRGTGAGVFALEARVLADWRTAQSWTSDLFESWFRRAAIGACALALLSVAWNQHAMTVVRGDELAAVDSAMRMGIEP